VLDVDMVIVDICLVVQFLEISESMSQLGAGELPLQPGNAGHGVLRPEDGGLCGLRELL
jgi:hypothetical protein